MWDDGVLDLHGRALGFWDLGNMILLVGYVLATAAQPYPVLTLLDVQHRCDHAEAGPSCQPLELDRASLRVGKLPHLLGHLYRGEPDQLLLPALRYAVLRLLYVPFLSLLILGASLTQLSNFSPTLDAAYDVRLGRVGNHSLLASRSARRLVRFLVFFTSSGWSSLIHSSCSFVCW